MMRVVTRGRFRQLVGQDGGPVVVKLYGCAVDAEPYARAGKTYMTLDVGDAVGDLDVLRAVDDLIFRQARPAFTPVQTPLLYVKLPPGVAWETVEGGPAHEAPTLRRGDLVDVCLHPGAFGAFGYCLLAQRVKPSARGARPA